MPTSVAGGRDGINVQPAPSDPVVLVRAPYRVAFAYAGPDRIWSGGGPLADAAHGHVTTKVADLASQPLWAAVGLATGSVMVGPVRTEAGLWAVLEVWSDFRDAFTPHDVKLMDKVVAALAKKTPAA